ncbi:MAG: hypothetical protein M3Y58_12915 [Chloroflexota bacterium]|nr:hypothetical protein [Chloroflexota bacterium]
MVALYAIVGADNEDTPMVTHPKTFTRIVRNPETLGGEPDAPNAEYVYRAYPFVTRADVDEALAYYDDHRTEIDWYIAENEDDLSAEV